MLRTTIASVVILALSVVPSFAQEKEEESRIQQKVVVTGMKVTQGGAQDIKSFRGSIADGEMIPPPGTFTAEGLLSEYDLTLAEPASCDQLFCLSAEAMPAKLIGLPDASSVMALQFGTNLNAETWQREPLTLVAVVDKSGSMRGQPLETAKHAMQIALSNLRDGDRMGVVQYGSAPNVLIPVTDVATQREVISQSIASIQTGGATAMEAGLTLAFETAREAQSEFDGRTRVMLFTDTRPNVGRTDQGSFAYLAKSGSEDGIGLTTIGVSPYFGAELANQIAAARGGNLFFMRSKEEAEDVFDEEFDFLVSELAHDLRISITPSSGSTIEGVYGVPGESLVRGVDGSVSVTVPSVFLSSKSGALVVVLSGDVPEADVSLTYVGVDKVPGADALTVSGYSDAPSTGLQMAGLLVDEFVLLNRASETFYAGGDLTHLTANLKQLEQMFAAFGNEEFEQEITLISSIADTMRNPPKLVKLHGDWVVKRVSDRSNSITGRVSIDIRRNDRISIDMSEIEFPEWELERLSARGDEEEHEHEYIGVNDDQIYLEDSDVLFRYRFYGDRLQLRVHDTNLYLTLVRPEEHES